MRIQVFPVLLLFQTASIAFAAEGDVESLMIEDEKLRALVEK